MMEKHMQKRKELHDSLKKKSSRLNWLNEKPNKPTRLNVGLFVSCCLPLVTALFVAYLAIWGL